MSGPSHDELLFALKHACSSRLQVHALFTVKSDGSSREHPVAAKVLKLGTSGIPGDTGVDLTIRRVDNGDIYSGYYNFNNGGHGELIRQRT